VIALVLSVRGGRLADGFACHIWIFREVARVPGPPRELRVAGQGATVLLGAPPAVVLPRHPLFLLGCGFLLCPNRVIYMSIHPGGRGAADWRKSRRSVANGACVEVAAAPEGIIVRDSVNQAGATLRYSSRTWRTFLAQAKTGKFDVKTELTGATAKSPL
jgi:Domain of unknown function (DUF397)